ncbi:hypothetical protein HMPREF9344_00098 [Cutibacterium acnes HL097PA1]|nr:hypothetical protein HMPREF9344_00098 [Cutibacterium acnes HL097PA1]
MAAGRGCQCGVFTADEVVLACDRHAPWRYCCALVSSLVRQVAAG